MMSTHGQNDGLHSSKKKNLKKNPPAPLPPKPGKSVIQVIKLEWPNKVDFLSHQ